MDEEVPLRERFVLNSVRSEPVWSLTDSRSASISIFANSSPTPNPTQKMISQHSHSMRDNYNNLGVNEFYRQVSAVYRNPHYPGVVQGISWMMDRWWQEVRATDSFPENEPCDDGGGGCCVRILDLACGSGEATLAVEQWLSHYGGGGGGRGGGRGGRRRNDDAMQWPLPSNFSLDIQACDPFTAEAYHQRTGRRAESWSFMDILQGKLLDLVAESSECPEPVPVPEPESAPAGLGQPSARQAPCPRPPTTPGTYDICICSFAAHLMTPSELHGVCSQLALTCRYLMILSPHKRPTLTTAMGWDLVDSQVTAEMRVHARLYASLLLHGGSTTM